MKPKIRAKNVLTCIATKSAKRGTGTIRAACPARSRIRADQVVARRRRVAGHEVRAVLGRGVSCELDERVDEIVDVDPAQELPGRERRDAGARHLVERERGTVAGPQDDRRAERRRREGLGLEQRLGARFRVAVRVDRRERVGLGGHRAGGRGPGGRERRREEEPARAPALAEETANQRLHGVVIDRCVVALVLAGDHRGEVHDDVDLGQLDVRALEEREIALEHRHAGAHVGRQLRWARTSATIWCPSASSRRQRWIPMKPVAPVTKNRIVADYSHRAAPSVEGIAAPARSP